MARAIAAVLPEVEGVVIVPRPAARGSRRAAARGAAARGARRPARIGRIRVLEGEHPVPGRGSFAATRALVRALRRSPEDATVLLLLSGGASALLAMPARGISARDKVRLNRAILEAGLPVSDMNTVRKHVSLVKGGGLLRLAAPREVVTLALSDVVGDDLATIGSGPAVADPTTAADAARALARGVDVRRIPRAVRRLLAAGHAETVKPGDRLLARSYARVVGSNRTARAAAARRARALGYRVVRVAGDLSGPASACGVALARSLPRSPGLPTAVVAGGETVVDARGTRGRGGRSQELALSAARALRGTGWVLLAAGTDGVDGATPAAGAIVDGVTAARAGARAVARALAEHDSHGFFARHGGAFETGPTGTNAMDLVLALHPGSRAAGRLVRRDAVATGGTGGARRWPASRRARGR